MKEVKDFICETYNFPEDISLILHAVDTYYFQYEEWDYYFICAPTQQELAGLQALISYLHNKRVINQEVIPSFSGSDFIVYKAKYCTLYKTPKATSVYKQMLTKTRLAEILSSINVLIRESEYLSEIFISKENYVVPPIAEKVVRQLSKAKVYFEEKSQIKVSAYDSVEIQQDMISLLENQLRQLIEKLNTDISRTSVNLNIEKSFYLIQNEVKLVVTDKIFIGHPFFLFAKLAAEIFIFESSIEEEDLITQIQDSYENIIPNHFTMDFLDSMVDIYLLISLYKKAKQQEETGDQKDFRNIAKGLYRSKVVEWV